MINYKNESEIDVMKQGGARLRRVVNRLIPEIKPGIKTIDIDSEAERLIGLEGGEPSFNKVKGYRWSTCLSINEQVVHTPPSDRIIKPGDVFTLDIGMFYQGFHTDFATSLIVGESANQKNEKFLSIGRKTLDLAIGQAERGNQINNISAAIEKGITGAGYFILKELTGHGVGRELHEDPYVPGYVDKSHKKSLEIRPGLVIAIEVIYSKGSEEIAHEKGSDWSIISADKSLTACFEHTVAITEKGTSILT
jgi:methionyl aminopeptidase